MYAQVENSKKKNSNTTGNSHRAKDASQISGLTPKKRGTEATRTSDLPIQLVGVNKLQRRAAARIERLEALYEDNHDERFVQLGWVRRKIDEFKYILAAITLGGGGYRVKNLAIRDLIEQIDETIERTERQLLEYERVKIGAKAVKKTALGKTLRKEIQDSIVRMRMGQRPLY
ncbi:hypothetical protein [Vibrio coralliilyticus]|uniref:hypothetical protein n=1 Tax=Vibrio coralliilyticus TaxID=190893 RepID=UPI0015619786|nr:hypothetical protein [Vibrio coralliilyticus]NRF61404.1 hypothetical protein [Vibrio coralliilyticus]